MKINWLLNSLKTLLALTLIFQLPSIGFGMEAQGAFNEDELKSNSIAYNHLTIKNVVGQIENTNASNPSDLKIEELSVVEENIARNLNTHWAWRENTLDMIDSYSPFLFRTKKSQAIEEVKVILEIDTKGKISGFEILGEIDKGTKERVDYMLRKLPDCKPVPGYAKYTSETFELVIKK